jgi:hypothetical protein
MFRALRFLVARNPAFLIVLYGLVVTYAAAIAFFIEIFNKISYTLLCVGGTTLILGVVIWVFVDYAKDCMRD